MPKLETLETTFSTLSAKRGIVVMEDRGNFSYYLDMIQKFGVSVVIMKQHESARTAMISVV